MNLTTYLRAGYPGLAVITSEEALGKRTVRTLKPEHRHGGVSVQQQQQLGGS